MQTPSRGSQLCPTITGTPVAALSPALEVPRHSLHCHPRGQVATTETRPRRSQLTALTLLSPPSSHSSATFPPGPDMWLWWASTGLCCRYSETAPRDQREDSEPIPRLCCSCTLSLGPKPPLHPVVPGPVLLCLPTTTPPESLRGATEIQSGFMQQPVSTHQTPVPADPGTVVVPHTRDPGTPPHYCSEGQYARPSARR